MSQGAVRVNDPSFRPEIPPESGAPHIWRFAIMAAGSPGDGLESILSNDERSRSTRLRREDARRRFITCRGVLRLLLGAYLDRPPESLDFGYALHGKPYLKRPATALRFNVSHSAALGTIAVSTAVEIGVDVELTRPRTNLEGLAGRYFAPDERDWLLSLPEPARLDGFYRLWTCKEAFIKAKGDGLSYPLDQFSVRLDEGRPARLRATGGDSWEVGRWTVFELEAGVGYRAACVSSGPARLPMVRDLDTLALAI